MTKKGKNNNKAKAITLAVCFSRRTKKQGQKSKNKKRQGYNKAKAKLLLPSASADGQKINRNLSNIKRINMSFVKIILHCVWSTKRRYPALTNKQEREELFAHIHTNAKSKDILLLKVGGHFEHIHILLLLGKNQDIATVMQLIKGESSFWFSKRFNKKIEWQDDYFSVSIGESQLSSILSYIDNQESHHAKKTFQIEYEQFMSIYKFDDVAKATIKDP